MAPKRAHAPSSSQTSSDLYLTQSQQDLAEVEQPRPDDEDRDTDNGDNNDDEQIKKRARVRREWAPDDEITILEAVADYRRKHKKLPERATDNIFFEELAQRLEDRARKPAQVKDKVKSLERRYFSAAAHRASSDSSHGKRLNELSAEIWGVVTLDGTASKDEDDNGGDRPAEMADMYPLVAQKVDALASVQPAVRYLFELLDHRQVGLMEKDLEAIGWSELSVDRRLERMLHKASKKASKKK